MDLLDILVRSRTHQICLNTLKGYHEKPFLSISQLCFLICWLHSQEDSPIILTKCFVVVQSFSHVPLLATPWNVAHHASLSFTISQSLLKLMSIDSVTPSKHLILCRPLFNTPSIFLRIRVFSNELALYTRWPKDCSFSFKISPSKNTQDWSLGWTGWISLHSKGLSRIFSITTVWKHRFFSAQLSSESNFHIHTWTLEKP